MVNTEFYKNGKIYKIIDNTNGNIYIGSTCKKLCQRIAQHRKSYKRYLEGNFNYITSFKILENDDYDIILIEEVNCENKEQLRARERYYIESLECVNKKIEGRTKKEYDKDNKDKIKKYYVDNKNKIKKYTEEYRQLNKDIINAKQKNYYEKNKDIIREHNKEYYETKKAKLNAKILCPCCNVEVMKRCFKKHEKSNKHQKNLNEEIEK
jgi:hypothetical protein